VIETKSHHSEDARNGVHKLFGELLKETGRKRKVDAKFGVLIPSDSFNGKDGEEFYRSRFKKIKRDKYLGFGCLIPVNYIFVCSNKNKEVKVFNWIDFYDKKPALRIIKYSR